MVIGTNTANSEPNYLILGKVKLPVEDTTKMDLTEYQSSNYGIGLASGENRIEVETRILHDGPVNRARF